MMENYIFQLSRAMFLEKHLVRMFQERQDIELFRANLKMNLGTGSSCHFIHTLHMRISHILEIKCISLLPKATGWELITLGGMFLLECATRLTYRSLLHWF